MKLLGASFILTCDSDAKILHDGGILIDEGRIQAVGDFQVLKEKYQHCDSLFYKNHIILPALINAHIHFEFSKNTSSFMYGGFDTWLNTVMQNRDEILKNNIKAMQQAILTQKKSGVGTVCAISSYDLDLELLLHANLRVIFCHEVLGANSKDFENQVLNLSARLEHSLNIKHALFQPALALHAPYSVHPKLAHYVIDLAAKYNLLVSTHFLESKQEYEWLESRSGYFKEFYSKYFQIQDLESFNKEEFLALFVDVRALFIHCLYADSKFKQEILRYGSIVSCPRSNLLLNGKAGDNTIIATDGKSSNNDVNLLEEMRYTFFSTIAKYGLESNDIESLAKEILYAVTCHSAQALGLNNGVLQEGKDADIAIFKLDCENNKQLVTNFILHAKEADSLLINGVDILSHI
ncbi:aminofutalosine deaminase family hydrolase [Helicobacter sp. MIT 14-3879]|uniref:aminofutalosine deaminase family hydrolase n=1 Tax=Helicobacter sp. MIT 14-3879 TaxID=2040649 RepID=UPI000E1E567C|nr:aminofutalosine deaminase family hydrolase [Helicobacter sp. MIT 14-3879]RDU60910.1 metal-dependent hydrolase [Helicobacter sp. MIT 14-3879]